MTESKLIYLSLGANLGDRFANLERAIQALPEAGVRILRRSSIYETEPVDYLDQPWFLNCAVEAETCLKPRELLEQLQSIERNLGSRKLVPRGPRMIDIDILFYAGTVIHEQGIEIPHPRLHQRRFVLVPLAELAPEFPHPVLHKTAADLQATTQDRSVVRVWNPEHGAVL
jgi:2-amino-4-hydroxy-6-hydroxymethyldihydropteridine diphosphokinase